MTSIEVVAAPYGAAAQARRWLRVRQWASQWCDGGDEMTVNDVPVPGYQGSRHVSVDELFAGAEPVRSADDLARDGLFDGTELDEFLADLRAMRHADVA